MKDITDIGGLQNIKSMHSSGKRTIPRIQSSAYLDLFMLKKKKDRLEKEIYLLDKKKKNTQKRLDEIDEEIGKLKEVEANRESVSQTSKKPAETEKKWKMMSVNY